MTSLGDIKQDSDSSKSLDEKEREHMEDLKKRVEPYLKKMSNPTYRKNQINKIILETPGKHKKILEKLIEAADEADNKEDVRLLEEVIREVEKEEK